jgi:hypothetical protein
MKRLVGLSFLAVLLAVAGCDTGTPGGGVRRDAGPGGGGNDSGHASADADGDGIPDDYEGRTAGVDTDGDGTPDYMDTDSDADGIPDMVEGGSPGAMPIDSDSDGTPDFRDTDSDNNGIPDMTEGTDDPDGDRQGNYRDTDNDGDLIPDVDELMGTPTAPPDHDMDGTADYLDTDSDNDTISDRDESVVDTDHDMTPDRFDLDSDEDGIPDAMEAGDADVATPPVDTDGDRIPDFRDTDSDNDGLSDSAEVMAGTSPTNPDSDGDGVSDLVEVASGTNPLDMTDNPRSHGNFVFVEPYLMDPSPMRDTLDFATNIRQADVYFLIDTTGSMSGAINSVRSSLSTPTTGIIDTIRAMIPDTNFGVGDFKDYADVYLFRNDTDITPVAATAQAGVNALSASGGGDGPEGDVPSLFAVASGMGVTVSGGAPNVPARTGCAAGTFGYPCFRSTAVPIVVLITDAQFHNGRGGTQPYAGYLNYDTMLPQVQMHRVRVIGVAVNGTTPQADLNAIAMDSGAVDGTGAPLVTVAAAGSVSSTVVDQVRTLAGSTRFDISLRYEDDPSDSVDTYVAFVDHIEATTSGDVTRGCVAHAAIDTDVDGYLDTFTGVTAGERVCFDIFVKQNRTVMPTSMPQLFQATLHVLGDGFTELDSRSIYFLVPPEVPPPGGPG